MVVWGIVDPGPRKFNQGTPHPTGWYPTRCLDRLAETESANSLVSSPRRWNRPRRDSGTKLVYQPWPHKGNMAGQSQPPLKAYEESSRKLPDLTTQDKLYLAHVMNGIAWAIQSGTTRATNAGALVGFSSISGNALSCSSAATSVSMSSSVSTSGPGS
jgi:hypothetical protein